MSAMFEKACRLYDALDAAATDEKTQDERPVRVFRGIVSPIYAQVQPRLSMAHWSPLFKGLYATGAVTQLQKGARNTRSVYVLHHRPQQEDWNKYERNPLTRRMDFAILKQKVENIEGLLQEVQLRQSLETLKESVARIDAELQALKTQLQ